MKTVAIIQARMGSNRLPGKVLMDLGGKPMIARVCNRVAKAKRIDQVVVATSTEPGDDPLADYCLNAGWSCYRGGHLDVLDRYYQAAREHAADVVVRVTADCPLIDPELIDQIVGAFLNNQPGVAYASNTLPPRTYPRGLDVEVFSFAALEQAWNEATDAGSREHVTPYLYRSPDKFGLLPVRNKQDASHHRWTVDTSEDLELLRAICAEVSETAAGWLETLAAVERRPQWQEINAHIQQKAA